MSCCLDCFGFSIATDSAGKSFCAFLCAGRCCCDFSIIIAVIVCFGSRLTWWNFLTAIGTISITGITLIFTGSVLFITDFSMQMFCCFFDCFSFSIATDSAGKSFYTRIFTGRACCNLTCIPVVIVCFDNRLTWWDFLTAIGAISITGIAFILTGSVLFITDFAVKMLVCCLAYRFGFSIATDGTGKSFYAFFYTGRFCCDFTIIPMIITFMYSYCWHICYCQSVQRCR